MSSPLPDENDFSCRRLRVCLAEDSEDDIFLVSRAIESVGMAEVTYVARQGEEAMQLIRDFEPDTIDLVLLDINLPVRNGFEILVKLRETPALAGVPVIMFSSSSRSSDICHAYSLGASAYVFKPSDYDELKIMLAGIIRFFRD